MPYVYLILSVFCSASTNVFGKWFNRRCEGMKDTSIFYNFLQLTAVFLGWCILFAMNPSFDGRVLLYSILFGLCFFSCNLGIINALKYGPTTLTSLFISMSLLVTTTWGFIFWDTKFTIFVALGLILMTISVYLFLKTDKKEETKFSFRWLFYVLLALFGNSGCSIVQRTQQVQFHGEHGSMLMLFASGFSALVCLGFYLKSDKKDSVPLLRNCGWLPVLAGAGNIFLNLLVMRLALTDLSPGLIYPVLSAGGLMVVTLFSIVLFREKLRKRQWIGIATGALAIVLLSL